MEKIFPGRQLMEKILRMPGMKAGCIDFLPGNLNYKEKVATKIEPVHELHFFKSLFGGYWQNASYYGIGRFVKKLF